MTFGHFDDQKKEYVINTPFTPYPWINYLGNKDYFALFSNTSGGYSFFKDARLRRITRFRYNNVPVDNEGRYFFIKDGGETFNVGGRPMSTPLDSYQCRHGMGYSIIESSKNALQVKQTSFVPLEKQCEVHRLVLINKSNDVKTIDINSYVEWNLWNAYDDMTNFQRNYNIGEVEVEGSTIYHKTEYKERRNHYAFYAVNHPLVGFDTDRESFIGLYQDLSNPDMLRKGSQNSIASGWSPIASHHVHFELQPNESKSLIFVLGYIENKNEEKFVALDVINKNKAQLLIDTMQTDAQVDEALIALKAYWDKILSIYQIESNHKKLNRMVNIWNTYQNMTCFNMSRSASYFESGVGRGMGFRDSNQDILGFVHIEPDRARDRLYDLMATQLVSGSAYHQYSPLTKQGNEGAGTGFNDDPCWLLLSVTAYIKETGDFAFLKEQVPFENNDSLSEPVLEHLKRAYQYTLNNLGPHELPLIGRADWNDCLNLNCFSETPGESFQTVQNTGDGLTAESVFIAGLFIYASKKLSELLKQIGDDDCQSVDQSIAQMIEAVETYGEDPEWFLRAYDAKGNKVGSNENEDGKIYIEPQGMCVMAGIGIENGFAKKALNSTKKYLDTDYGMVLNYPAYKRYQLELGEISSYPRGYKENGGIFCHNNPWVMIAFTKLYDGESAFNLYKKIAPAYLEAVSDIHRTEPYVYSQMIAGKEAVRHGEAKNSWLTGTASWNYVAITQHILGVVPTYEGLCVNPIVPDDFGTFKVKRAFRGAVYDIDINNQKGNNPDNQIITINGESIEGHVIPFKQSHIGKIVHVKVVL